MSDFRGARGSNTGDDFHELWATRHAIRLLLHQDGFEALAVEGLAASDERRAADETLDWVDCTLYFGGSDAATATKVLAAATGPVAMRSNRALIGLSMYKRVVGSGPRLHFERRAGRETNRHKKAQGINPLGFVVWWRMDDGSIPSFSIE